MTIHVLVEGPSEHAFLGPWAKRLLKNQEIRVHPHEGKGNLPANLAARPDPRRRGLLDLLPAKLRAFAQALDPSIDAVVVLVDADDDDHVGLLERLTEAAAEAHPIHVAMRLAVEEVEAFYLGDLKALRKGYPNADMATAREYQPDSIVGTWELFGQVIHDGGGNKVAWAETMGPLVTTKPSKSRSPSFKKLIDAFLDVLPKPQASVKNAKHYRHPVRGTRHSGGRR